jgi:hypothetical protein
MNWQKGKDIGAWIYYRNPEEERPTSRSKHREENNIKINSVEYSSQSQNYSFNIKFNRNLSS